MANRHCSQCGNTFVVPDWLTGQVRCPRCGASCSESEESAHSSSSRASSPTAGDHAQPSSETPPPVSTAQSTASASLSGSPAAKILPKSSRKSGAARLPILRWLGRNKFIQLGLFGALGCLGGAVIGEFLLAMTRLPPSEAPSRDEIPPQAVCLLIDCSGSMTGLFFWGAKLREAKVAARDFARAQIGTENEIAVLGFGSSVRYGAGLTRDTAGIERAVDGLADGGSTAMAPALTSAARQLTETPLVRNILLFTDGAPNSHANTLAAAHECRDQGIRIVAIATGDADVTFLEQVTGDPSLVIPVTAGNFGTGFSQAAQKIYGRSLVESAPSAGSLGRQMSRVAGWTALIALGVSVALILGQNLYLGRRALSPLEGAIGTLGGLTAGFLAGAVGQILFAPFSSSLSLQSIGTMSGWWVLGALVGRGMAIFVPNLAPRRAWIGGGIGGVIGAAAFLYACSRLDNDVVGRLLGASILGLVLGLLIAFIETAFRNVWLEVRYGPTELVTVNLGKRPVTVGGDASQSTIFAMGAAPVALRYRVDEERILCEDIPGENESVVAPGDERTIGNVTVTVRATRGAGGGST